MSNQKTYPAVWRGKDLCIGRCCLGVSFPADSVKS
jgi:hypothetical protein